MCLWGRNERKVVSTVSERCVQDGHGVPQPNHREVRPHQQRAGKNGREVCHDVLDGVAVNGSDGHWSGPLVMDLVDVLVQQRKVDQPKH